MRVKNYSSNGYISQEQQRPIPSVSGGPLANDIRAFGGGSGLRRRLISSPKRLRV